MQVFVRDASTLVVDAEASTTVQELKERWSVKAFGVASSTWVSLCARPLQPLLLAPPRSSTA